MYDRKTKIFFGFMVIVMGIGFPLSLVASFPAFQGIFTGQSTGNGATVEIVEKARETVREKDCADTKSPPKGKDLSACKTALEDLGAGYSALSAPTDPEGLEVPKDSERNLEKSLEAYELLHRLDPQDDDSVRFLGVAYQNQGNYAKALPLFRDLAKSNPEDPDFVFAWASTAQAAEEKDEAVTAFKAFLKLAPEDARADSAKEAIKAIQNPAPAGGSSISPTGAGGSVNLG